MHAVWLSVLGEESPGRVRVVRREANLEGRTVAEGHVKCRWRNCEPVLIHGKFCEINDPVSSVNNLQGAGMKGTTVKRAKHSWIWM